MAKLDLKKPQIKEVLDRLTPSWEGCVDADTLAKAQVAPSSTRNWLFGNIINTEFIKLKKAVDGHEVGTIVSIADIYNVESAQSLAGLIIFRLAHPGGLLKQPTIVELN